MKTDTNNIKRNTLRRMAAVALLLMAFTVSAEAKEVGESYESKCRNCNSTELRVIENTATCTSTGWVITVCVKCGYENTYMVPALGHDWGATFGDYVAPTCTTAGGYNHTCQRDGCGVTELDNSVAALGHDWGEWTDVAAATCTVAAQHSHTCQRDGCGVSETCGYGDPLGHTWGADYHCIRGDAELPAIAYVKADGTAGSHQAFPITGTGADDVVLGFENGDTWYYLSGEFNLRSLRLTDRTANIILTADCNITIHGGINAENGSLNIYTQSGRGILHSAINTHGDVHIHGGYVNAYNSSVGGDLVLGWTNTNDQFRSSSISAGGTITIAEGKALINATNESEIFYGDGTAIDVANISGKILDPKTDVLCYVGADDHAHFLNDGDYTVLTTETAINPESSSADAVQWLVVRGNVEFTSDLSLCGTTHLILLDDAVLTASSNTTYALYTEKVTNIYGSTKGNGRIEVPNGDLYAGGLLNIYGGNIRVSGTFKGRGTKNFSWTRPGNSIYANNYENSAPNLAKPFTDGDDIYYGSLTADNLTAIAGKTLQPCVLLTVGADNDYSDRTSELGSWAGKNMTVAFQRAFTDGAASTVCLPFPMTSITGGNVYGFRGITWDATLNNEGGWVATMIDQSPEAGNLLSATEANKPYLFMPNATGDVTFTGTIASVPAEITAGSTTSTDTYWTFQGTYSRLAYGTDPFSDTVFGFAASTTAEDKEKGQDAVTAGEFVKAISGAYIPAFRAFLKYSGSDTYLQARGTRGGAGIPETITVRLIGKSGEIDGIGEIRLSTGEVTFDPNAWYDLNGRKLDGKPSEKGIYINGGRKVVIK